MNRKKEKDKKYKKLNKTNIKTKQNKRKTNIN